MTKLGYLPDDYFRTNEYRKVISGKHMKLGEIKVRHFKSSYDNYKVYTFIEAKLDVPYDCEYCKDTNYEFQIYYDQNMSLEDFDVEWEKVSRKWEKILKFIIEDIEVYDAV